MLVLGDDVVVADVDVFVDVVVNVVVVVDAVDDVVVVVGFNLILLTHL